MISPTLSLPGEFDWINELDQARLVTIPGTSFKMGIDASVGLKICQTLGEVCDLSDFANESPAHKVEVDSYSIYQFEVTNAQYKLCVEAGVCNFPAFTEFYNDDRFAQHPVVFVNWFAANDYCTWAGGRLPTEAEWELAARGTDGRLFPWGDDMACGYGNYAGCTQGLTAEIGSFPAGGSPFGVFDMAGNVTEWVEDWYSDVAYQQSATKNPTGPTEGEMRVAKGGSWKNPIWGVRSTNRVANFPGVYSSGTGFRCMIPGGN
ncbi:MAG: formylglycine-generating enzyme family protein [Anaerolineales bacterium]